MADDGFNLSLLTQLGGPVRSFKAGDIIFREGDAGTEVFVVKSGRVEVRNGERLLDELSDHDLFGEMALVDTSPRSATAVAKTDVEVVPLTEKQFVYLVGEVPYFALKVMRVMARRLRAQNQAG
ncbi:MAG: cyclic nucleotide-binding domain-containing protein [Xanthobacteraceae bacterium]